MRTGLFLILLLCCFEVNSQTISTEAPSVSASGTTVPKYSFQVEASLVINHSFSDPEFPSYTLNVPSLLLRYGLSDKFELRGTGTNNFAELQTGIQQFQINDIGIGLKYEILNREEGKTQMAIISHFNIFNQGRPFVGASLTYALSHSFNDRNSIGFNLGGQHDLRKTYAVYTGITSINSSLIYNLGITEQSTIFAEFYSSSSNLVEKNYNVVNKFPFETSFGIDAGLTHLIRDNIQFDCVLGTSLEFDNYFAAIGLSILLNSKII